MNNIGCDNVNNKNLILVEPKLEEYSYEQKLLSDPDTMSYNAGYDVSYDGYHYDTGCIDFPESKWINDFEKRKEKDRFFAYIKDIELNEYVGYVNYHYNKNDNRYECGIVIEGKHRNKGYSKIGLKLLCEEAFKNGINELYDNFEKDRENTLKVFESIGFKIIEETKWKKFGEYVDGVVVCIKKEDLI
ncbi:MAG: GNAT family N-acetyltransferase [Lactobacillales bacterium]|nr:GNAT family N-acetyltransferase [Lactobacillales bacterium]